LGQIENSPEKAEITLISINMRLRYRKIGGFMPSVFVLHIGIKHNVKILGLYGQKGINSHGQTYIIVSMRNKLKCRMIMYQENQTCLPFHCPILVTSKVGKNHVFECVRACVVHQDVHMLEFIR
jgi:hypothetical protein